MDSKYFFTKLEKEIEQDWEDCGTAERDFFFALFDSQIRLWQAAGLEKDDAVDSFESVFLETVKYYMEEYLKKQLKTSKKVVYKCQIL